LSGRQISFSDDARARLGEGLDTLANAVRVTLGPAGRTVALDRSYGAPLVTRDGVTVAKEIVLDDHLANLGAQLVKEVASQTGDDAGDGTTTATVLAQRLFAEGTKLVSAGVNPMELKRGIDASVAAVVAALEKASRPVDGRADIAHVGRVSANGDAAIGELIADAMEKVGRDGVITLEEAKGIETTLELVDGLRFDRGYLSPYFVTDPQRLEVVLADALVMVADQKLSSMAALVPLLELVAKAGKPLLIVADDVEGEALATLVVNKLRGTLAVCAVKAPGFGDRRKDLLGDLAARCGAMLISEEVGFDLELLTLADLGHAKTVTVTKDHTTLVGGGGLAPAIAARVAQVRVLLEKTTSDYDREKLRERLAQLTSGVALISVGAATELELKERKSRFDDALHATRAAVEEGIVPGGGVALLRAGAALRDLVLPGDQHFAVAIVRRALEAPLRQLVENAGLEGAVVVDKVQQGEGAFGYDVAKERYGDLLAAGILDPTKVVRVALQNAASVVSLMLTTEAMIASIAA
jgi:chaperonin GroEL